MDKIFLAVVQPTTHAEGGFASYSSLILIGVIIVIFYFFMMRPQQKRQKKIQEMRNALKKGDKIMTAGGIHGKIVKVDESTFDVEIADDVIIKIEKTSVYTVDTAESK